MIGDSKNIFISQLDRSKGRFNRKIVFRPILRINVLMILAWVVTREAQAQKPILSGEPLTWEGDISAQMVEGIDRFLGQKYIEVKAKREQEWLAHSNEGWDAFITKKSNILKNIWGMKGERLPPTFRIESDPTTTKPYEIEYPSLRIQPIQWTVSNGLDGVGLLVQPTGRIKARVVLIPDADQYPENLVGFDPEKRQPTPWQPALELAGQGIQVVIPALISRKQDFSGSTRLNIFTNQPHREWIYRQGFNIGRHIIGFELLKIASCIDWFEKQNLAFGTKLPTVVAGYGEGGMLALFTAAIDERVDLALTSGYIGNSESLWSEPIYRNMHGILAHAGGAELLAMAAEKAAIVVEYSEHPPVDDPIEWEGRRGGAAPGKLTTPQLADLKKEVEQARRYQKGRADFLSILTNNGKAFQKPFSAASLQSLCQLLNITPYSPPLGEVKMPKSWLDVRERERQQVEQLEVYIQYELELCEKNRNETFWKKIQHHPGKDFDTKRELREFFHQTIGKISDPLKSPAPRLRLLESNQSWEKYEVVLDVWDQVFAWGILVIPQSARLGKKLPVVVCQHGLEGLPSGLITRDTSDRKFQIYKAMALTLAESGYVTFSPHNPYRGEHAFRTLQRKANPIGLSLFSVIAGQHQQIVNWLASLEFVEKDKIGFYGLSYGGKTAMRIPALVEGYALSICSGDFNEWIRKVATTRGAFSYQFTKEYEIYEWDLGNRFNYAEMAALIAPRPFMVEYGYRDGIGTAEWIGYEFGKVRKHFDLSGISDRLDIDLFDGYHEIHGVKTYPFLDKHLKNTP